MKNDQEKFRGLHNQEKKFFTYSHKNFIIFTLSLRGVLYLTINYQYNYTEQTITNYKN